MFAAIKEAYHRRARESRRAALSNELESIYAARRYFNQREKEIVAEAKKLDTQELHLSLPMRRVAR